VAAGQRQDGAGDHGVAVPSHALVEVSMTAVHVMGLTDVAASLRAAGASRRELEDDIARLEQARFGAHYIPQCPGRGLLLVGLRSGLEAALALTAGSHCTVEVLLSRPDRRCKRVLEHLQMLGGARFKSSAWNGWKPRRGVFDTVRIDAAEWEDERALSLLHALRPKLFVGEAPIAEPATASRLLRQLRDAGGEYLVRIKNSEVTLSEAKPVVVDVSVVVPAYGVEDYLDRCLESLTRQTVERLEIIVVDDGSIDRSGVIADEWARRHPDRIRTIHRPNGGCAAARMTGLAAARGEYIAFVDADDWVTSQMMERLHTAAQIHRAEIAQCGYVEMFSNGERRDVIDCHRPLAPSQAAWGLLVSDPQAYLTGRPTIWRRLYRRDFLINSGAEFPAHLPRFDDLPFQFVTIGKVRRMVVVPEAHYFYESARPGQDIAVRDTRLFVHFPIFEWLAEATREWTTPTIEARLAHAELNSHLWALSVIDDHLKQAYRCQAASLFLRRRAHLSFLNLVKACWMRRFRGLKFLLGCLFMAAFGRSPTVVVDSTLRSNVTVRSSP
jgi:glycosyltransferase involved in cell wall biosynthesis